MYQLPKGQMNDKDKATNPSIVGESTVDTGDSTCVTREVDASNLSRSASADTESVPTVLIKPKKTT